MFQKTFYVYPHFGKWSNLTDSFQMVWNHQLVNVFWVEKQQQVSVGEFECPQWL